MERRSQVYEQRKQFTLRRNGIREGKRLAGHYPASLPPPETPVDTMEFLARSWSLSAIELSTAIGSMLPVQNYASCAGEKQNKQVVEPLGSSPLYAIKKENVKFLRGLPKLKSIAGRLKDRKQKRRADAMTRSAQIYAATSVAGVAATVAASATGAAFSPQSAATLHASSKTSAAIAAATTLVASHCAGMAQATGATREQILAIVGSAVSTRPSEEIMALTGRAATALRAAAILRARLKKDNTGLVVRGEKKESQGCLSAQEFVFRGGLLLKRTRKGDCHWKQVSVYINSNWKVILKMKSSRVVGTFVKEKKCTVLELCSDIPAWTGRKINGNNLKAYFGIRTGERLFEFECRNEFEKQMWVKGVQQTLNFHAEIHTSMSL